MTGETRMEVLAVIPARGGSKSIPRKNLALFAGQPLVVHSIRHARASKSVTRIVVSTEDVEIASVARAAGAEVPFLRPGELAGDTVLDLPVFEHLLSELARRDGYQPDIVVHLRPTAPWRAAGWIDDGVALLAGREDADSVRSVSMVREHPWRMFEIASDGFLRPLLGQVHPTPWLLRRQDLPPVYHYNCVLDVTRPSTISAQHSMTGTRILPLVLVVDEIVDIDGPRDLAVAEALFGEVARRAESRPG
jgi:N-acylneuraminate cytidylyltransferase